MLSDLLRNRSFASFLFLKCLGSCNDSFIQSGFLAFVTYALAGSADHSQMMVFSATGLFMLPVFLFSALAGELADRYDKTAVLRCLKILEICIALLITVSYFTGFEGGMLVAMFLTGTEATFFTPVRLSIVPFLTGRDRLVAANSAIESGSYLAKFLGTVGGIVAGATVNPVFPLVLLSLATAGYVMARRMAPQESADPDMVVHKMFLVSMVRNLGYARHSRQVFLSLTGLAGAWCVTVIFMLLLSQVAGRIYEGSAGAEILSPLFLGLFCLGIGAGAAVAAVICRQEPVNAFLPLSAVLASLMMVAFTIQVSFHVSGPCPLADLSGVSGALGLLGAYLTTLSGILTAFCVFGFTFFAAMFIVPVTAYLQSSAPDHLRSRIMAANNITAAVFTVAASLTGSLCTGLLGARAGLSMMMAITSVVCLLGAVITVLLLPIPIARSLARRLLGLVYHVRLDGMENFQAVRGHPAVLVANHTSFLDGVLLWIYLHDDLSYAVDTEVASRWYFRPLLAMAPRYFTVDPTRPMAVRSLIREISLGHIPVIFPEGRITTTGTLMKVYPGSAVVADRTRAKVLPVIIEGGQYSIFSHFGTSLKKRPRSRISIRIMPAQEFRVPPELAGRRRTARAGEMLYDLMARMKVAASTLPDGTLFAGYIRTMKIVGGWRKILEDHQRRPLTVSGVFIRSMILGRILKTAVPERETGVLLPNSAATAVVFMALQAAGKLPCMLNFSAGARNILSSCAGVPVRTVLTSRQFAAAGFGDLIAALEAGGLRMIYLEDLADRIGPGARILGLISRIFPEFSYRSLLGRIPDPDEPAVVLFTSGSEGAPKGVALSHRNIETNIVQLQAVLPFGLRDSVFNAMPVFHSFGLTAGTLLPLLSGMKVFMYPSPLHYKNVPLLIYDTCSTAVFGTDTFLRGYGTYAHPYDMHSVRFAVAGGERLSQETADLWQEKFGIRLLEGYGATETSPVIAVNTFMHWRRQTVGQPLPGMEIRLEPAEGIREGGRLWVRGGNVMLGYLRASRPGILDRPEGGWYDTGDIADIDSDGFLRILGRARRFAKIGGEMVSLSQVEEILGASFPEYSLAVIAVPDPRKGEQLVLFFSGKGGPGRAGKSGAVKAPAQAASSAGASSAAMPAAGAASGSASSAGAGDGQGITREALRVILRQEGLSELALPRQVVELEQMPLNGTGKVDYPRLAEIAGEM